MRYYDSAKTVLPFDTEEIILKLIYTNNEISNQGGYNKNDKDIGLYAIAVNCYITSLSQQLFSSKMRRDPTLLNAS